MSEHTHELQNPSGKSWTQRSTETRNVSTYTVTETVGGKKTIKTITEETIVKPDGEKIVNRKETVTSADDKQALDSGFGVKVFDRNSGSSSDSSPERGESKGKAKTTSPQEMSEFLEDCLKAHNVARAKHGVPNLKLAKDLSAHAQKWAEELAVKDRFEHSKCMVNGERVGENIAMKWSSGNADYRGQAVVDNWYKEIEKHDFHSEHSPSSGHFTQVVWKESEELGVGKAKTDGGKVIVVANYRPAGNLIGSYRQNVFPPK